jgi:DNA-binding response OmpR family regulator
MLNGAQATILLVEPDATLRRLLALGLQSQGMRVIETNALDAARQLPRADLLLIDMDSATDIYVLDRLPIVVLTWETPAMTPAMVADNDEQVVGRERVAFVAKPFDARALYSTISDLLAATISRESAQPQLAALSASSRSSMSIWPLITAVGLLIVIVGFMLQIAISAAGLLIVLIALLWWTLGTGNRLAGA